MTDRQTDRQTAKSNDFILIRQATKKGYIELKNHGCCDMSYPTSQIRRGRVQHGGDVTPTITTGGNAIVKIDMEVIKMAEKTKKVYRIRKLTPTECHRLMNVEENDIKSILGVVSNSQAYKIAGNAIVVACMCAIFSQLNIKGVKKWNDMTDDERYDLIYKGCHVKKKIT